MTPEQFDTIKQPPRQATVTDIEDLCDEIERLTRECALLRTNEVILRGTIRQLEVQVMAQSREIGELQRRDVRRRDTLSAELGLALSDWKDAGAPADRVVLAIGNLIQQAMDFVFAEFDDDEGSPSTSSEEQL